MRHLKKFNELKSSTYRSASRKLGKIGQTDRAKELSNWGKKVEVDENSIAWKKQIDEFSKFGTFKLDIKNPKTGDKYTGNFYLNITFDRDAFLDSYDAYIEDGSGSLLFFIGAIPVDQETRDACDKISGDNDMNNGFFWAMWTSIEFKLSDGTMTYTKLELDSYDTSVLGVVSIADRVSAGRFKTLLKKIFTDKDLNYQSGYSDITNMYDNVNMKVGSEAGFSNEYGFDMDTLASYINTISANELMIKK